MRLVLIEWLDAFSTDDWTSRKKLERAPDFDKSVTSTVGWLMHDGDDFLTVVPTKDKRNGACSMTIPRVCVQRILDIHVERTAVSAEKEI